MVLLSSSNLVLEEIHQPLPVILGTLQNTIPDSLHSSVTVFIPGHSFEHHQFGNSC